LAQLFQLILVDMLLYLKKWLIFVRDFSLTSHNTSIIRYIHSLD
jgi:hypothetical protein